MRERHCFCKLCKADSYRDGLMWQWVGWSPGVGVLGERQEKERERSHLFSWREIQTGGGRSQQRREASEGTLIFCLGAAACASSARLHQDWHCLTCKFMLHVGKQMANNIARARVSVLRVTVRCFSDQPSAQIYGLGGGSQV